MSRTESIPSTNTTPLRVALVQMPVRTSDPEANLHHADGALRQAHQAGANLVLMPELWTSGFNWPWNAKEASAHGWVLERVSALAKQYGVWLAGSILASNAEGRPVNTLFLHDPEGRVAATYDKIHLFSLSGEDLYLAPGESVQVASSPWGKIGLTICYDLRFPELWRKLAVAGAEIMLCPAGFPDPRREHWRTLLRARAIENQCFVVAVNRVGEERIKGTAPQTYFGASCVIDPWGEILAECGGEAEMAVVDINVAQVASIRAKMTVLRDRRPELY